MLVNVLRVGTEWALFVVQVESVFQRPVLKDLNLLSKNFVRELDSLPVRNSNGRPDANCGCTTISEMTREPTFFFDG